MSTVDKLDPLIADQLQTALPCSIVGRNIIVLEQTGSTNDAISRSHPHKERRSPVRRRS